MRLLIVVLAALSFSVSAADITVTSPDKSIVMTFTDKNELAQYAVSFNGKTLIQESKLGFTFLKAQPLYRDFKVTEISRDTVDSEWEQPWGEQRVIRDNHNEVLVRFDHLTDKARYFFVRARVFNDGFGFRYEFPDQGEKVITRELTEFWFTDSHKATAYWIPGQARERHEYEYRTTPLQQMEGIVNTPATIVYDDGTHVAIHEAALVDFAGMSLKKEQTGRLLAKLSPRADGTMVRKSGAFNTPWRMVLVGDEATDLVNSYVMLNLNEPNKLGNELSWIEPGKYVGIWWCMHIDLCTWGQLDGAGKPTGIHGATTERTKHYMDFAAKYGFDGVLVEGWNVGWDGDWIANSELFSFTQAYDDFDIKAVSDYGKKLGVRLIGHHETSGGITNYEAQMEDGFALYQKMGVRQIKTGYVAHGQNLKRKDADGVMRYEFTDSQDVVNHFIHNVATAAKYNISINTHESVKDTGLRRTYPNWIARESARGQEYNSGWGAPNQPEHLAIMPYTRMLASPMDFTPGIFDFEYKRINFGGEEHGLQKHMRPQTTLAKQLAEYVVLYSPIQMAADLPENYEAKLEPFQFILDVPTDWEVSKAIQGDVGEYIVQIRKERKARQYSGNDWYLGALTDEQAREISVPLTFLDAGKTYEAQIYRDGNTAHWADNPYDIVIEKRRVTATDTLNVRLAESGGVAVRFKAL